jgi:CelD/BcsL family acetyltransferase involved in cellulose biosynthesis
MNLMEEKSQNFTQVGNIRSVRSQRLESLLPEWNDLYRRYPSATPFQHPEWLLRWINAFFSRNLIFIETRQNLRLVGLAPLLMYPRGQDQVLAFAGGGISDYLNLLCEPGLENEVLNSTLQCALAHQTWNVLELTDIPSGSPLLDFPVFRDRIRKHDRCSVLDLPGTLDDLLHIFSKRQRANLRNALSRLLRAGGGEVETATPHTASDFLEDLFRMHTSRWSESGQPGVLYDPQVRKFHQSCAPKLIAQGILRIHRLRIGNSTAAVLYSLWDRGKVFCYLQGFDPAWSFISPGTLLMFSVMKEAIGVGMRQFDFLRGAESYKQHWRPRVSTTYCVATTRPELQARISSPPRAA